MALALQEHGIGRQDRLGRGGEETYGRRNFLELFSVFTLPPLFAVRYGHQELGFRLCQSIKRLLASDDDRELWSRRARHQMHEVRQEFAWLDTHGTVCVLDKNGEAEWWTFAGAGANATLAYELPQVTESRVTHDSFTVTFEPHVSFRTIDQALGELRARDVSEMRVAVDEGAIAGLKFSKSLPHDLALDMLQLRLCDPPATQWALEQPVRFVDARNVERSGGA